MLIIIVDIMAIVQDKLLLWTGYDFGWFSWPTLLYTVLLAIIIRYTVHRIDNITAAAPAAVSTDAVRVRAVVTEENAAESVSADDNKEEV